MAKCDALIKRAQADFRAYTAAYARVHHATNRLHSVEKNAYGRKPVTAKAITKARAAFNSAHADLAAASARLNRTFTAHQKCVRE